MTDFTHEFREHARSAGVDLLGIAPVDRFDGLAKEKHPCSIFPETRSVIVVGKRVTRGALRGVEEGTQFDLYQKFGRDYLNNRTLAMCTFRCAEFLEDRGWEAVPLPNLPPQVPPLGVPVRPGQAAPNVMLDFDDAAVRAGVGEIGLCGLLLTPQFGPRQRIQLVLTEAELEPDALLREPVCDRCIEQRRVCPLDAIDPANTSAFSICGKEMPVARIDDAKCRDCKNGAFPNPWHSSGKPDRMAALCTRSCIQHLEKTGRIRNTFRNPFRTRDPWAVVTVEKVIEEPLSDAD